MPSGLVVTNGSNAAPGSSRPIPLSEIWMTAWSASARVDRTDNCFDAAAHRFQCLERVEHEIQQQLLQLNPIGEEGG